MLVSEYRIGAARFFAADRGLDLPPGPALEKLNQCVHFAWISHWIYIYQPGHHAFPHPKDAACRFFPRRFHSCSCVPKAILPVSGRRTLSILSPLRRRFQKSVRSHLQSNRCIYMFKSTFWVHRSITEQENSNIKRDNPMFDPFVGRNHQKSPVPAHVAYPLGCNLT